MDPSKFATSIRDVPESDQNNLSCVQSTAIPPEKRLKIHYTASAIVIFSFDVFLLNVNGIIEINGTHLSAMSQSQT